MPENTSRLSIHKGSDEHHAFIRLGGYAKCTSLGVGNHEPGVRERNRPGQDDPPDS